MKKILSKIAFLFLFFTFIACLYNNVQADTINRIDIDVVLNQDGSADVREIWDVNVQNSISLVKHLYKYNIYNITNIKINDGIMQYEPVISDWDNQYGRIYAVINDEDSLPCIKWETAGSGNKKYIVEYKISNLVNHYADGQALYYEFLNEKERINVGRFKIKFYYTDFNNENAEIDFFGTSAGNIDFIDNNIIYDSKGKIDEKSYVGIYIVFKDNPFIIENKIDNTLKDLENAINSEVYEHERLVYHKIEGMDATWIISFIIIIVFWLVNSIAFNPIFIIIVILLICKKYAFVPNDKLKLDKKTKNIPGLLEIDSSDEIPFDGDLNRAYWYIIKFGITDVKYANTGLFGAYLYKLIREDKIKVKSKDNDYLLDLSGVQYTDNEFENHLIELLAKISDSKSKIKDEGCLKLKDYKVTSPFLSVRLCSIFKKLIENETKKMVAEGILSEERIDKGFSGRTVIAKIRKPNENFKEGALELLRFKKYLIELTHLNELDIDESIMDKCVELSLLFNISDDMKKKINSQMELYPENDIYTNQNISMIFDCVDKFMEKTYKGINKWYK